MQAKFVGRWVPSGNSMTVGYPGSSFSFKVSGTHNVTVTIGTSGASRVAYKIDGGSYVKASSGTFTITGLTLSTHTIKVVLNTSTYTWTGTNYATVSSITVDQGGEIVATNPARRRMLVFGDSITQGYMYVVGEGYKEAPELTYWNKLGDLLAADMIPCGFGGIGYAKDSDGHYPMVSANPSYIENISSTKVNADTDFDIILILLGVNDYKSKTEVDNDYVNVVTGCITRIKAKYPSADIHALIPFNNNGKPSLEQAYNAQGVHIIPQTWYSQITFGDSLHPNDNGHTVIANNLKSYFENYYGSAYFKEASMKRIDTVYMNTNGEVRKVTGTMANNPVKPILPSGAIRVADVVIEQGASTGTIVDNRDWLKRYSNLCVVNVKDYGAKGDGTTDDTAAIQSAIDNNPGKKIVFGSGTYLISSPIITSATDSEKVVLDLCNAMIKASSNFTGDWMIDVGGAGTEQSYFYTYRPTGVVNGVVDGGGVATGGVRSEKTSEAHFENLFINNVLKYGMQLDRTIDGGLGSSDAILFNVNINRYGSGAPDSNSIGLIVNGYDNNIFGVRTDKFTTGIQINGGGNYFANCHPLWHNDDNSTADLQASVGFDINADDIVLVSCYSDMFLHSIEIAEGKTVSIRDFIATGDNTSNTDLTRICIKQEGTYIGSVTIDGLRYINLKMGRNYVGYDGAIIVQKNAYDITQAIPSFKNIKIKRQYLQEPQTDKLLFSMFNHDDIRPKVSKDSVESWDLNNIIANGVWPISGTFSKSEHVWADSTTINGTLIVKSAPRLRSATYNDVIQKIITDGGDIYYRRYFAEEYPIDNNLGWKVWKAVTTTIKQ